MINGKKKKMLKFHFYWELIWEIIKRESSDWFEYECINQD
jgi:hypothetical protein